jgi:hypothetical protein
MKIVLSRSQRQQARSRLSDLRDPVSESDLLIASRVIDQIQVSKMNHGAYSAAWLCCLDQR